MRTYLVIIDDSEESRKAQRFAGRRAARTAGSVHLLVVTEKPGFVAWGGVQATMEAEIRDKAEEMANIAANSLRDEFKIFPRVTIQQGDAIAVVKQVIAEDEEVAALVLGAAASGPPGPLVAHFAGNDSGTLPVPVMIVPGSLSFEEVDRLS